jgi:hypothetical protein
MAAENEKGKGVKGEDAADTATNEALHEAGGDAREAEGQLGKHGTSMPPFLVMNRAPRSRGFTQNSSLTFHTTRLSPANHRN